MKIDCDVEIEIECFDENEISAFSLVSSDKVYCRKSEKGIISISTQEFSFCEWADFELALIEFLRSLENVKSYIFNLNSRIRFGMFYNLNETVVFPFFLSKEIVGLLNEFGFSMEVSCYPCDEES